MNLSTEKTITQYNYFLDKKYKHIIDANISKKHYFVNIDFMDIAKYDLALSEQLLENPDEQIKIIDIAIERLDTQPTDKPVIARIVNLPDSCKIPIWEIRQHFTKFIKVEGILLKQGDILLRPEIIRYECHACGGISVVHRKTDFEAIVEPTKCSCGRKGKPRKIDSVLRNYQKIVIEEDLVEVGKRQEPKSKLALLLDDLTDINIQKNMSVGKKVILNGWLKVYEKSFKGEEPILDTFVYVNSIEFLEVGWEVIKVPNHIVPKIKEMSTDPLILDKLKQSVFPDIHGEELAKEALVLQMAGAGNKQVHGKVIRGTISIALVGSPGTAKTFMAKNLLKFWPISRFTSSQTSSGRGLIAAVVFDKQLEKWTIVPGIIPCCNKGLAICDEFDKMNEEEYGWMNNTMNDLEVYIDKVAHGRLDTDTAILATMDPEGRHWNNNDIKFNQITLPGDLIDRFDIIFPLMASEKEDDQNKIIDISMDSFFDNESTRIKPIYDRDTVILYLAMARSIKVKLPEGLREILKEKIKKFTNNGNNEQSRKMSNRIYSTIYRLTEAHARIHLRDTITEQDLDSVMDLLLSSYKMLGLVSDKGIFNYESYERVDSKKSNLHSDIKIFLRGKEQGVYVQDLISSLSDHDETVIEEMLDKMKRSGEIFEPKSGWFRLI